MPVPHVPNMCDETVPRSNPARNLPHAARVQLLANACAYVALLVCLHVYVEKYTIKQHKRTTCAATYAVLCPCLCNVLVYSSLMHHCLGNQKQQCDDELCQSETCDCQKPFTKHLYMLVQGCFPVPMLATCPSFCV